MPEKGESGFNWGVLARLPLKSCHLSKTRNKSVKSHSGDWRKSTQSQRSQVHEVVVTWRVRAATQSLASGRADGTHRRWRWGQSRRENVGSWCKGVRSRWGGKGRSNHVFQASHCPLLHSIHRVDSLFPALPSANFFETCCRNQAALTCFPNLSLQLPIFLWDILPFSYWTWAFSQTGEDTPWADGWLHKPEAQSLHSFLLLFSKFWTLLDFCASQLQTIYVEGPLCVGCSLTYKTFAKGTGEVELLTS